MPADERSKAFDLVHLACNAVPFTFFSGAVFFAITIAPIAGRAGTNV